MATTEDQIKSKRESVDAKRAEIRELRRSRAAEASSDDRELKMKALNAEDDALARELASLRGESSAPAPTPAPAPAAPAPTNKSAAADTK